MNQKTAREAVYNEAPKPVLCVVHRGRIGNETLLAEECNGFGPKGAAIIEPRVNRGRSPCATLGNNRERARPVRPQ